MGIFDDDGSEEEVQISPNQESAVNEGRLKSEVESKVVQDKGSKNGEGDGKKVSNVASGSQVSEGDSSKDVGIEDVYRQNERIIELLEEISGNSKDDEDSDDNQDFSGDVDGVL